MSQALKIFRSGCRVAAFLLLFSSTVIGTAYSHHSFTAEFDVSLKATLRGVITEVWFKNPHVRYVFEVSSENGEEETWDARGSPVVWLLRKGWTKDSIKVGDHVEMYGYLGHGGRKMLSIMTITLPDGQMLIDKPPE
ncbi:MAG: hypothetical protein CMO98_10335 [Woeseia sp.]|nr:hypothetical protein [Woeseia sp.]